jgi:hypothetical protein
MYACLYGAVALSCNVTREYVVKDSTGKIVGCSQCAVCPAGNEPGPPCGSVVSLTVPLRECNPCKKNHYSAHKDFQQCRPCQKLKCVPNEIVGGHCESNKQDTSFCTGHCKKGYIMSRNSSACVMEEPQPTEPSATTNSGNSDSSTDETGMSTEEIAGIVIGVVVFVAVAIIGLVYCIRCRKWTPQRVSFTGSLVNQLF